MASNDKMERQRILFLDLARGLALVFMIMQHAMLFYTSENTLLSETIILFGTAPAAPVFMLIMGIFFVRSRRVELRQGIIRGLKLLVLGYLLNLVRFTLPELISGGHLLAVGKYGAPMSLFFTVDILQMAGLSIIIMSIIRKYLPGKIVASVLAVGIVVVSPFLWGICKFPGSSLLWGTEGNVYFPLFPWIIYPLLGMVYSNYFFGSHDKGSLMKRTWLVGFLMFVAGALAWDSHATGVLLIGDYSRSGPVVHVTILGFVLMWLSILWWLVERNPRDWVFEGLFFLSRNVTVVYFIQWTIVGWGILLLGFKEQSPEVAALIGVTVACLTYLLTYCYVKGRALLPEIKKPNPFGDSFANWRAQD